MNRRPQPAPTPPTGAIYPQPNTHPPPNSSPIPDTTSRKDAQNIPKKSTPTPGIRQDRKPPRRYKANKANHRFHRKHRFRQTKRVQGKATFSQLRICEICGYSSAFLGDFRGLGVSVMSKDQTADPLLPYSSLSSLNMICQVRASRSSDTSTIVAAASTLLSSSPRAERMVIESVCT